MITRRIYIWDWEATFLFPVDGYDDEEVYRQLVRCDAPNSIIREVSENLEADRDNEGFCFSSPYLRRSVIYVGLASSGKEFLSTVVHEIAHLAANICTTDGVSLTGEPIAYLSGDIALQLSDIVCHYSCEDCRCEA